MLKVTKIYCRADLIDLAKATFPDAGVAEISDGISSPPPVLAVGATVTVHIAWSYPPKAGYMQLSPETIWNEHLIPDMTRRGVEI